MQAVILAAGKSTRTYPLTLTRPKPLLKVVGKTLLEYNLDNLNGLVSEVILVVGYKKNMIKKYFGEKYKGIRIKYIEQKQQLGTGHALLMAENHIKNRFLLMMGDDIYARSDIKNCSKHRYSILASRVKNPGNFGVISEKNSFMADFVEKPKKPKSNLANNALYSLDKKIFIYLRKTKKSKRREIELPDALKMLSEKNRVKVIKTKKWKPIVYPWDLFRIKKQSIGRNCTIKGRVKNSIIMDNTVIGKGSVVENSIIGENVYFDGKIIAGNNVYSVVKGKKINAGKLGAIIGDNVKARNVIIAPGCKIWPGKKIKGEIRNDVT